MKIGILVFSGKRLRISAFLSLLKDHSPFIDFLVWEFLTLVKGVKLLENDIIM